MVKNEIAVHTLSEEECRALLLIIEEQQGLALSEDEFVKVILGLFENIPGFETMALDVNQQHLNELWSLYMGKKPAAETSVTPSNSTEIDTTAPKPVVVDLNPFTIRAAIEQGKALITEGKTKADAARALYNEIQGEPKEVIVASFFSFSMRKGRYLGSMRRGVWRRSQPNHNATSTGMPRHSAARWSPQPSSLNRAATRPMAVSNPRAMGQAQRKTKWWCLGRCVMRHFLHCPGWRWLLPEQCSWALSCACAATGTGHCPAR